MEQQQITTAAVSSSFAMFKDGRDGKVYKTIKIGNQWWMAENLDFADNGGVYYSNAASPMFDEAGRLYTWQQAMEAVPDGWHLPSNAEWQILADFAGGNQIAGQKLKARVCWNNDGNGTDEFGFDAIPCGYRSPDGSFGDFGDSASFCSATDGRDANCAYIWRLHADHAYMSEFSVIKSGMFSVRCVQSNAERQEAEERTAKELERIRNKRASGESLSAKEMEYIRFRIPTLHKEIENERKKEEQELKRIRNKRASGKSLSAEEMAFIKEYASKRAKEVCKFTDPRDGKVYKAVQIGEKVWMAENLNYAGGLYTWQQAREAAPKGWHLPSNEEWNALATFLGGGGNRNGSFNDAGSSSCFWSATEFDDSRAWVRRLNAGNAYMHSTYYIKASNKFSVRYVKDTTLAEIANELERIKYKLALEEVLTSEEMAFIKKYAPEVD